MQYLEDDKYNDCHGLPVSCSFQERIRGRSEAVIKETECISRLFRVMLDFKPVSFLSVLFEAFQAAEMSLFCPGRMFTGVSSTWREA